MNYLKIFSLLIIVASCSFIQDSKLAETSFSVEGEIGEVDYKNLIEDKLNNLKGVDHAVFFQREKVVKVSFNNKLTTKKAIKKYLESFNGGSGYLVSRIVDHELVSLNKLTINQKTDQNELPIRISFPSIFRLFLTR